MTGEDAAEIGPSNAPPRPATLGAGAANGPRPAGVRVVLDVRPLQEPDRAPLTATYLAGLLGAYDADPLPGESFAFLLRSDLDDPTSAYPNLDIVGRRLLPPTHLLRSGAQTIDPFLLRGASLGAAWRAERGGAAGAVYHTAGAGPLPLGSGLPIVATLLDLAPWEMPDVFARSTSARFGQRLRTQLLREARAVLVGTPAVARAARHLLHVRADRVRVVGLAPRPVFGPGPDDPSDGSGQDPRSRLGLRGAYLVYTGRYDARHDLATLLDALALLAGEARPPELPESAAWPPRILVTGANPDDRASIARAASRRAVGASLAYAQAPPLDDLATLVRGARAAIVPMRSDGSGIAVIEAIASGTPVIASAVGALPDLVGAAGILVPPEDSQRLAAALRAVWADERVHAGLVAAAQERARTDRRVWADVARETRAIYAEVGVRGPA